ncbi:S41 family peptidase [soil metagenome]
MSLSAVARSATFALVALLLAPLVAAFPAYQADPPAGPEGTRLLRMPTVSDRYVAFVYANDLWVVGRNGGEARRLTSSPGAETNPRFSPDGRWIAFTGQYDGNTDVYVVPSEGGEPQRLTYHPGDDIVQGWTADGSAVLFTSGREGYPTNNTKFFTVPLEGGFPSALPIPRGVSGRISGDGRHIAYRFPQFWDPEWRNYRGGQAQPIWIVSLDDYELTRTPWTGERQLDPVWLDGVVYFLSERDYMFNVWSFDPRSDEIRQRTFHDDFDVKTLDAGGGVIVYEQAGGLHLLNPADDQARPLRIEVRGDQHHSRPRWVEAEAPQLLNASLSPTGQRALFEFRGQILTAPAEHGDWRNLSNTSGAAHRFPAWSPNGRQIAYFSDESGEYALVIAPQDGIGDRRTIALPEATFPFHPQWSPDGTRILYRDAGMNIWQIEIASGRAARVATELQAHPQRSLDPVWSPDSRYIAYARRLESQLRAIFIHDIRTGTNRQLTDGMSDAYQAQWDRSGKYLYFLASTDYGLNTGWLDMSSFDRPVTRGVYVAVLAADEPSPLAPRSSDEPAPDEENDDAEEDDDSDADDAEEVGAVRIDFDGIDQRILALPVPLRNYTSLHAAENGVVFFGEQIPNQTGATLRRFKFEDRETTEFLTGVLHAAVSGDGKKLLVRIGTNWRIVGTSGAAPSGSSGNIALAGARVRVDPRAEWAQIFDEGWRIQRDFLYVDNFHGAPWDEIRGWYRPWVTHVRHRSDLNYLLDMMGAEIGVGHSYVSGGDVHSPETVPVGLLGADYTIDNGRYRIARIHVGENWNPGLESPLSGPGIDVREGDYLIAVNGTPVDASRNLYSYFEGTAGRQITLTVNSRPTAQGARSMTVVPVANEGQIRMRSWVDGNRRRVDELSGGRLAYVWLPNTGAAGYANFNRYYFAQQDRQGAVIDQRNNGGGSAADYIADVLNRELQGYFNSPIGDRRPWTQPMAGIFGPKVMIINEQAGSGGDLLPYLFRQMDIGPLVGTRTWGGLVGIWDTPRFVDGGAMLAPRGGFLDRDGQWAIEGEGIAPDYEVEMTPRDVINGRDPQLERAVQVALDLLEANPVQRHTEPAPPVRWRMPVSR